MTTTHDDMPLPEPHLSAHSAQMILGPNVRESLYTADQLRARDAQWQARLEAAVKAEREACSVICENMATWCDDTDKCAAAIRARGQT